MLVSRFNNITEFIAELEWSVRLGEVAGPVRATYVYGGHAGVDSIKIRAGFPTPDGLTDLVADCGYDVPVTVGLSEARAKARDGMARIESAVVELDLEPVRAGVYLDGSVTRS